MNLCKIQYFIMLVESMNHNEISKEVATDWLNIQKSLDRLANEYDRERRKNKVDKRETYSRAYPLKTNKKNTWIVFFSKAPAVNSYKGLADLNVLAIVYYHNLLGLRVFKLGASGGLVVYNGHLFQRYNERMGLNISNPVDIVKHFLSIMDMLLLK